MADASAAEAAAGQAPMDVDAAAQALATVHAQLAAAKADLAVAKAHSAAVPKGALKQPDHFHGKPSEKFADYLLSWEAFQTASGSDRACWASYLITFMQGTALTYLRAKFGSALFSATYEQLVEALKEAQWGRVVTEQTLRDKLYALRLKRSKGGKLALSQLVHEFDTTSLECKTPLDTATACWLFTHALPAGLRSRVATDAAGQPWSSLEALKTYTMAIADAWEHESAEQAPPDAPAAHRNGKKHRGPGGNGGTAGTSAKPNPPDHSGKPSFVPGRTPQEVNALRKSGACFKCGKTGHKAANCKSS